MEEKVKEKDFTLMKVKLLPNGGLQANYQTAKVVNEQPCLEEYQATCDRDIHPDLKALFDSLRPIVARTFGITSFLTLIESDEMKLSEAKREQARAFAQELISRIDVRGLSWSGQDESLGIIITSVYETSTGMKTCINTPRIKVAQISFGFEEELERIAEAIKSEVYKFLFEGKQAQLSLFGDNQPE